MPRLPSGWALQKIEELPPRRLERNRNHGQRRLGLLPLQRRGPQDRNKSPAERTDRPRRRSWSNGIPPHPHQGKLIMPWVEWQEVNCPEIAPIFESSSC